MAEHIEDRRVQRTRALLRRSLVQLIFERGYDSITIQDITDRANLGRSTFYSHYQSKDDLLFDHHAEFTGHVRLGHATREQFLCDDPLPGMIDFLTRMQQGKKFYMALRQSRYADVLLRGIRQRFVDLLTASLSEAFPDQTPDPPLDVLVEYIVGAQNSFIEWWITTRNDYSAEKIACSLQRMQRAIIKDAYRITD